jgi:serine acetyltransferase
VYIGPGVKVIGAVTVGSGAVLLPGAVVIQDVPAGQKWGGVPAIPKVVPTVSRTVARG